MDKFRQAFEGKMDFLTENLIANQQLLMKLRDSKMLTYSQLESLTAGAKANSEKVYELLEILRRQEDAKFDVFCSILNDVNQGAIVAMIRPVSELPSGRPNPITNSMSFKDAFKGKKVAIRDSLEATNKLLRALVDKGVLIDHHERKIKLIADEPEKVDALLDILERRDDSMFNIFCDELIAAQQDHVVKIIRP